MSGIVAVTFTSDSAHELKRRIQAATPDCLEKMSPAQMEAVNAAGHTSVVACPGSGKTRVIVGRIMHLQQLAGKRLPANVGTFHSLARAQLQTAKINKRLINNGTRSQFIRYAWRTTGQELTIEETTKAIEYYKTALINEIEEDPAGRVYSAYQAILNRTQSCDFHDLMIDAVLGMRAGTVKPVQGGYLFVDEFQDTDWVQYEWVSEHAKTMTVFVVGDDDQTIYSWRHALGIEGLTNFNNRFGAHQVVLSHNYRCNAEILEAAGALISHNSPRVDKALHAVRGHGGTVKSIAYEKVSDEAEGIARCVASTPGDWAVLARTNRALDPVERVFVLAEIPYRRSGGVSLWERDHVAVLLNLLASLSPPFDNVGLEHAMHWAGFDEPEIQATYERGAGLLIDLLSQCADKKAKDLPLVRKEMVTSLVVLAERLNQWRSMLKANHITLVIYGVAMWAAAYAADYKKLDIETAGNALAKMKGDLRQRLQRIMFLKNAKNMAGVALMTLHGAKGLEFPNVWMAAMDEGTLPHDDSTLVEERRLCYVGMTRAKNQLVCSCSTMQPSRFLMEAGLYSASPGAVAGDPSGLICVNATPQQRQSW